MTKIQSKVLHVLLPKPFWRNFPTLKAPIFITCSVCGQRQRAEKGDWVDYSLMRGKGNIYPTSDYVTRHVMLANMFNGLALFFWCLKRLFAPSIAPCPLPGVDS